MTAQEEANRRELLGEILPCLRVVRGPDRRGEYVCWCPFHADGQGKPPHEPNLQVSVRGYCCHACGARGGLQQLAEKLGVAPGADARAPESMYDYRDETGALLYQVCRFPGKRFRQRRPNGDGGWVWNLKGVPRVLYRLPELLADSGATVYIVEGEKDADRLAREGLLATTNSGGAGKWRGEHAEQLSGRDVIILPDNDEPGRCHVQVVGSSLCGEARSVRVVELPSLPPKGDVSDWLAAGHTVDELPAIVQAAPIWQPSSDSDQRNREPCGEQDRGSQADRLVSLVTAETVELFHDDLGTSFARVPVDDHREIWRCPSRDFRRWLAGTFWDSEGKAIGSEALSSALNVVECRARFEGGKHPLHNRVAWHDGAIWYDLADEDWRAVKITGQGWSVVDDPPILFRRYSHQEPQLEPVGGGDLHDLLRFVNLSDTSHGLLLLAYLVSCFVPEIPHPILVLHGPQGSAKTTLFRVMRRLVDPSAVEVLSFPHGAEQLVQQLSHHWAPYYDNVSNLSAAVSDILCRAVTGEGFSKRELYSDDEDVIYKFQRCVGLNGINVVARKPDLLDRCLVFGLEPIGEASRKSEEAVWTEFEAARASLMGAALDALSRAMAMRDSIVLPGLPRMADFALWGCAAAAALGCSEEEFLATYQTNTEARNDEALQASPVAVLVLELMEGRSTWEGTPTELLSELESLAEHQHVNTKARRWPQAPHVLSRRLNEVRPNLAAMGITVSMRRDGRHRSVVIQKTPVNSVTCVTTDGEADGACESSSARGDAAPRTLSEPSPAASHSDFCRRAPGWGSDGSDADDAFPRPSEAGMERRSGHNGNGAKS